MPLGILTSDSGKFSNAKLIKSTQIGRAILDPYSSSPSEVKSSVPTQTVVTRSS